MLYANEQGHGIWEGGREAKGNKESLKKNMRNLKLSVPPQLKFIMSC